MNDDVARGPGKWEARAFELWAVSGVSRGATMKNDNAVVRIVMIAAAAGMFAAIPGLCQDARVLFMGAGEEDGIMIDVPAPVAGAATNSAGRSDAQEQTDVLQLLNGDILRGSLVSTEPGSYGLRWKHPNASQNIDFSCDAVDMVKFAKKQPESKAREKTIVRLSNGDTIYGQLVSLNTEKAVLDTQYGGRMDIKRSMIGAVHPNSSSALTLYEGPAGMSGWLLQRNVGRESWVFKNNALYAYQAYPIGRYIEGLPDSIEISFDASWRAYPSFYCGFFAQNVEQHSYSWNSYMLRVSGGSVYIMRASRNSGQKILAQSEIERFSNQRSNRARFTIMANRKEKKVILLIDGEIVRECQDVDTSEMPGAGIAFQAESNVPFKLGNIVVKQWDGRIPRKSGAAEEAEKDLIRFGNDDKLSGDVETIRDRKLKLKTGYGEMDVPLERVAEIRFGTKNLERARRNKLDVRAHLVDSGEITVELVKMTGGKVEGRSENFGSLTLPLEACTGFDFNIYEARQDSGDDDF